MVLVLVFQVRKQILDHAESCEFLVIGAHHRPRRHLGMGARQHLVACRAVVVPVLLSHGIDRAHLPLFERIAAACGQAFFLLGLADIEVVLEQVNAGTQQHLLEGRHRFHERLVLRVVAKAHNALDAGAVVPAAIEHDHFLGGGQVRYVTLEVPGRAVAI